MCVSETVDGPQTWEHACIVEIAGGLETREKRVGLGSFGYSRNTREPVGFESFAGLETRGNAFVYGSCRWFRDTVKHMRCGSFCWPRNTRKHMFFRSCGGSVTEENVCLVEARSGPETRGGPKTTRFAGAVGGPETGENAHAPQELRMVQTHETMIVLRDLQVVQKHEETHVLRELRGV